MRFSPRLLEEIKSRLPISEIVSQRVKLKKQGREWRGLSPFNNEKTPSFYVNDQKQFYHCFSSGKHGDIFGFLMETQGLPFYEAVEELAEQAGVQLPVETPEEREREIIRTSLYDVMELSSKFFEEQLQARNGATARGYLNGRGMGAATQLKFRLGFAPDERYALRDYLTGKNVTKQLMIDAGMLVHGHDIAVPYDRFRGRIMFPIHDLRGKIIAFGGRAMAKDVPAKYLNSPETELFHKGSTLYHGHVARPASHKSERLIAVEGYVDVIAMASVGINETVAPLGTALTEEQLSLLWQMADEPILLFDGDNAGQRAAFRALDLALNNLKPSKTMRFATLPQGQDPDDLIRLEGRPAIEAVLEKAVPLIEMLWRRETASGLFDTPERKAALETRLKEVSNIVKDETLRRHYRDDLMKRFAEMFPGGFSRGKFQAKGAQPVNSRAQAIATTTSSPMLTVGRMSPRETMIIRALADHPFLLDDFHEELMRMSFRHNEARVFLSDMFDQQAGLGDGAALQTRLTAFISTIRLPQPASLGEKATIDDIKITFLQLLTLHNRQNALLKEKSDVEAAFADDMSEENFERLKDVQLRLANIEGTEALIEGFGLKNMLN
jgi:DNA primase